MDQRLELHDKLCDILGSKNVYFQPPESIKLNYPCIIYELGTDRTRAADDKKYLNFRQYSVTLIYKDPDCRLSDKILEVFNKCSFNRRFKTDNLYHSVFSLYYGR